MTTNTETKMPPTAAPLISTGGQIQQDALYTTDQVSAILRVSKRTLERWRREGAGPAVTRLYPGSPPRYRGADLIDALDLSRLPRRR